MQPILAEHEKNVVLIRDTYLKVCRLLAIVAIPVSIFFSLNAGPIIYLLFGKQWSMAILPLSIQFSNINFTINYLFFLLSPKRYTIITLIFLKIILTRSRNFVCVKSVSTERKSRFAEMFATNPLFVCI